MNATNQTTTTAATAGAAAGGLVGWAIAAITGADTAPISTSLAVLGAFVFGVIFPGR